MLIPGIPQLDPQAPFGGRAPTARPSRRAKDAPALPPFPQDEVESDEPDDSPDPEFGQAMTLEGALAAYASS